MDKILQFNMLIFYIAAAIIVFVALHFLLRKRTLKTQMIFLYAIWGVGLILLFINKGFHLARGEHILAQLPLHLCYISLIFFIPLALRFKNKVFYDFVFFINAPGAFMALAFPAKDYVDGVWSGITFTYVVFHCIIVYIPLWLFLWKIYSPKITIKNAGLIGVIFLGLSLSMYGLSLFLVSRGVTAANYFWTLVENSQYNVEILRLFASLIPYDFLYIAAFALPILALYIVAWNVGLRLFSKKPKAVAA